jgi:hypothetical protein
MPRYAWYEFVLLRELSVPRKDDSDVLGIAFGKDGEAKSARASGSIQVYVLIEWTLKV